MAADTAIYELPEVMKIDDCERLHAFLMAAQSSAVTIECGMVSRMHGLAAQTIVMAARTWSAAGHGFAIRTPSPAFTEAMRSLGLGDLLTEAEATQ